MDSEELQIRPEQCDMIDVIYIFICHSYCFVCNTLSGYGLVLSGYGLVLYNSWLAAFAQPAVHVTMGAGASIPEDVHVVVVGGGYGGTFLGLQLMNKANFTLIDSRDAFHHNVATPRAIVEKGVAARTLIPYAGTFHQHFKQGLVTNINPNTKTLHLQSGEEIKYDACVMATGTSGPFPCKFGHQDKKEATELYNQYRNKVNAADRIVLIGGGAVGVEMATDIAEDYPDKEVTLIHSRQALISDKLSETFQHRLKEIVAKLKLNVIYGEKVSNLSELLEDRPGIVKTDKGTEINADLIIRCTGLKVNSEPCKEHFADAMDERGCLRVNEYLQVEGHGDVFALGDCSTGHGDPWLAYLAQEHAKVVAENLIRKYNEMDMKPYKGDPTTFEMVVSLGRHNALGAKKDGHMLPEFAVKKLKASDMLVGRYWTIMKQKKPPKEQDE